jgi:phenylpropionate dioxygenase-like ring-hydroxylating dioxygenase large terminal subunit
MLAQQRLSRAERKPRVLDGLHLGLPNHWYPILRSSDLKNSPRDIRRFGQELVVWRDSSGAPHVFESHCPHRGAPLSLGRIQKDELACSYHGWRFNSSGQCTEMPLEDPSSTRPKTVKIAAYEAADRAGYIWMFYGQQRSVTPLTVPEEVEDKSWLTFKTEYCWKTNWLNLLENVLDPLHAIHLHVGALTQRKRAKFKNFDVTQDGEIGFKIGKIGYRDDGSLGRVEGEVEFRFPNIVRLDIADGTSQGIYRVVIMPTPIDENNVCAFYARGRQQSGIKRLQWWLSWNLYYSRPVHRVAGQDGDILQGIGPIGEARLREHLASSDIGIIHLRKRLNQVFYKSSEPVES